MVGVIALLHKILSNPFFYIIVLMGQASIPKLPLWVSVAAAYVSTIMSASQSSKREKE